LTGEEQRKERNYIMCTNTQNNPFSVNHGNITTDNQVSQDTYCNLQLNKAIQSAITDKLKQLGLSELSHLQTKLVKQTVIANYKPTKREWLRSPTPQYLEVIERPAYKEAYKKIEIALANGETEITVNHQYALESVVAAYDLGIELVFLGFDMRSGKSWAYGWMVANHPAIKRDTGLPTNISIAHLESINISNATARNNDANWSAKHVSYQEDNFNGFDSLHTSFNSQKSVKKKALITDLGITLIDETEGAGNFFVSDVLENKWDALQSARHTIAISDFVVFTDAHAGAVTDRFIQLLTNKPVFTIKSNYKPWKHVNGYQINDLSSGTREVIKELKKAQKKGNAVASFFASAGEAKTQHRKIKKKFKKLGIELTDKQFPLITSQTRAIDWVVKLKAQPELFDNVIGFVASSSIGTGISIESKRFKTVFLFASNSDRVGDSHSQLQMPFRIRNIKTLYYVRCTSENLNREALEHEILNIVETKARGEFILNNTINTSEVQEAVKAERKHAQTSLYNYNIDIRKYYIADCLKRFENIEAGLKSKGIDLIPINTWTSEFDVLENSGIRAEIKKEKLEHQLATPIITADEAQEIVKNKRKNHGKIKECDSDKLTVYTIAKNLIPESSTEKYVPLDAIKAYNQGAINKRDRLQRAITHKSHINKIVKAYAFGVKDGKLTRLKKDLADTSPEKMLLDYEYDKYLASLLNITKDKQGYVLSIDGEINLDNANPRTKRKVVKTINNLIDRRNALKTNGGRENKITTKVDGQISAQVKSKITNRLGIRFKAKSKIPFIKVPRKTCPAYLLPVLRVVFGTAGKLKIESKVVTSELIIHSGMIELLTDDVLIRVNKDSKYKITRTSAKRQPMKVLKKLLDVAKIPYEEGKRRNGYKVVNTEYDAQYMADIAREKQHNNIAKLLAYIDSIGQVKN